MADITLLTSKKETFSIPEYSCFTKQGDVDLLSEKITEFLCRKFDREEISKKASLKYDAKIMTEKYIDVYNFRE